MSTPSAFRPRRISPGDASADLHDTAASRAIEAQALAQHVRVLGPNGHDERQAEREPGEEYREAKGRRHARSIATRDPTGY